MSSPHRRGALAILALALSAAACGTAVPHAEVLRDAGVVDTTAQQAVTPTTVDQTAAAPATTAPTQGAAATTAAAPVGGPLPVTGTSGPVIGTTPTSAAPAQPTGKTNPSAPHSSTAVPTTAVTNAGPATGSPVVIGQVGNFSGVVGAIEGGGQLGLKVWVSWANQHGGLNGHRIVLYSSDDGGDPSKALSIVQDDVENKHAVAIVGAMLAVDGSGVQSYVEQHQIPIVGGDTLSTPWGTSPMFFSSGTNLNGVGYGLAHIAATSGVSKAALLYCVEAAICSQFKNYVDTTPNWAKQQGVQLVYTSGVSLTQPSFTSQCQAAQSAGAQGIIAAVEGPSLERLAQSCTSLGYHPKYIASALAINANQEGNKDLEGVQAPSPDVPYMLSSTPATQTFAGAINSYAPGSAIGTFTMIGWISGMMLQKALSTQITDPTAAVTSQQVLNGLWQFKNETLQGLTPPLTFVKGQPAPLVKCAFLVAMVNGKFTAPNGTQQFCSP